MTPQVLDIEAKASVAIGAATMVAHLTNKTVWVSGTFVATIKLQGSLDGTNWIDLQAALATATAYQVEETLQYLRTETTGYTSGTPVVKVTGHE